MNIITISREFGSGGRELGKRLAEALGYAYYDREILTMLSEQTALNEDYLERTSLPNHHRADLFHHAKLFRGSIHGPFERTNQPHQIPCRKK